MAFTICLIYLQYLHTYHTSIFLYVFVSYIVRVIRSAGFCVQYLEISTSSSTCLDQKWRRAKKLPESPNSRGPLTDLPDFSYLDGRPAPLGKGQQRRIEHQQELARKIVEINKEINFAVDWHKSKIEEKEAEKQRIIDSKLKPKGHLLLKK